MKLSKSILSPSHARDPPLALPTSLSRRLKANGSMKGGQSPATFPSTTGKKRESGFDNPEPSSPKVTCIGQVKMKTKKKVKQTRSLPNRRSDGVSFRKLEQAPEERGLLIQTQRSSSVHFQPQDHPCAAAVHRNQRWVHLPWTIYEALREYSCLFPCRSSCFTTNEKVKEEKVNGCMREVPRWLVALQDGPEAEKTRGMEDVHRKTEEMQNTMRRSSTRHVFEDISVEMNEGQVDEEKARVSICIPPKNALLLMRCRSDPMKMADITYRKGEQVIVDAQNMEECKSIVSVENEDEKEREIKAEQVLPESIIDQTENIEDEIFKSTIKKVILLDAISDLVQMESKKQQSESMEVSRETWVCSTDFNLPDRKQAKTVKKKEEEIKTRSSIDSQPSRLPAAMIEQKLAYEPFVLTRCKSEPMGSGRLESGFEQTRIL
ncbi:hypothetical protein K7X08_027224 [Anisodus acutangulus]|uniref:Uncharacterized protein n=1 Tax=Anisodus acutangulus TaxID=402998 RepID=A0A9Q1MJU6_9SOLA|nr:hypothetical protein K7X08_027224 [Anisodus acutangulus]